MTRTSRSSSPAAGASAEVARASTLPAAPGRVPPHRPRRRRRAAPPARTIGRLSPACSIAPSASIDRARRRAARGRARRAAPASAGGSPISPQQLHVHGCAIGPRVASSRASQRRHRRAPTRTSASWRPPWQLVAYRAPPPAPRTAWARRCGAQPRSAPARTPPAPRSASRLPALAASDQRRHRRRAPSSAPAPSPPRRARPPAGSRSMRTTAGTARASPSCASASSAATAHLARGVAEARQQRHHRARLAHAPEHLGRALPHAGRFVVEPPGERHRRAPPQRRGSRAERADRRLAYLVLAVAERALERLDRAHRLLGRLVRPAPAARAERLRRRRPQPRLGIAERRSSRGSASATRWRPMRRRRVRAHIGVGIAERRQQQRPRLVARDASSLSTASRRRPASGAFSSLSTASMLENRSPRAAPPGQQPATKSREPARDSRNKLTARNAGALRRRTVPPETSAVPVGPPRSPARKPCPS